MNRPNRRSRRIRHTVLAAALLCAGLTAHAGTGLRLGEAGYFSKPGLDVLAFSNVYDGNFSDAKIAGVELIHHGVRTATNGDVRLAPTPDHPRGSVLPLQIEIEDDGPGIPDAIAAQIFEPFVSGRENGTGLGLALVSKIVTDHGGWLRVDSRPGRTIFRISLPKA